MGEAIGGSLPLAVAIAAKLIGDAISSLAG